MANHSKDVIWENNTNKLEICNDATHYFISVAESFFLCVVLICMCFNSGKT